MKTKDTKRKTRTGAVRRIGALFLALTMTFGTWTPAFAEEPVPVIEEHVETPAEENEKGTPEVQETPAQDEADGLDIGPEIVKEAVGEKEVPAPTINKVLYEATSVSGGNLFKEKVNKKIVIATVYVTVKDKNEGVKAEVSVTPTSGKTWKVKLPTGVEIEPGDTVTAYQVWNGIQSPEATADAEQSLANQITLKMPTGEIWIEQTSSNIVNEDEQKEAQQMLKDANPTIKEKIKTIEFSIDGTDHAYYEVTYTDESPSGKVEAKDLKIRQVAEYSRGATLNPITVVDNKITGKLEGEGPFDNIKVQIVVKVGPQDKAKFCDENKCKVDKDSSKPVDVTVDPKTG